MRWALKRWIGYGAVIIAILACTGCGQKPESVRPVAAAVHFEGLMLAGSGSNLALTRRLAEEYSRQSGKKIEIPGSIGTSGAVKATREGAISLGLTSRELTTEEKAQGLKQIQYASVGLAVAVHSSVPDKNIDFSELVQIVAEEKTAWSNGAGIVPLLMYEGDSTNQVLKSAVPGFSIALKKALVRNNWQILYSEGIMLETLLKTPNSIGFIDAVVLSYYPKKLKAMTVNGVAISAETLETGRYPLKKDLFFIYKDPLSDDAKRFIDFCFSEAGGRVIRASGALPAFSRGGT